MRQQLAPSGATLSWSVRAILALAAVLCVASLFAVWANRQLLDNGDWTRTSTKLLENRAIKQQLSVYLTRQLYANVDIAGALDSALPRELQPLVATAADGLHKVVEKAVVVALGSSQVARLWRLTSEATHRQLVALIENRSKLFRTPGGGAVVLDLRPIVASAARAIGVPRAATAALRGSVGEITVLRSRALETMQGAARGLRGLAIVLPALALVLLALAIGLSRGRRARALLAVGGVAVAAGLLALLVRSLAGTRVVDAVTSTAAVRPAASAAWSIATSLLVELSVSTICVGLFLALVGLASLLVLRRRSSGPRRALRARSVPFG